MMTSPVLFWLDFSIRSENIMEIAAVRINQLAASESGMCVLFKIVLHNVAAQLLFN